MTRAQQLQNEYITALANKDREIENIAEEVEANDDERQDNHFWIYIQKTPLSLAKWMRKRIQPLPSRLYPVPYKFKLPLKEIKQIKYRANFYHHGK